MAVAVLSLGNPLLDIVAEVGQEVLDRYGLELNNAVHADERHRPLFAEVAALPAARPMGGGMLLNATRAAQWLLQEPEATAFLGCVGADAFAETLHEACRREGVRGEFVVDPDLPTGCCAVLTMGGERALCTQLSAARSYSVNHLREPRASDLLARARVVYCAVLFPPEVVRLAAEEVSKVGGLFCVNLSAPFVVRDAARRAPLLELLPQVDVLFGNEREALTWAEVEGWETTDVAFVATRLSLIPGAKHRRRTVVITRGEEATVTAVNGHVVFHPVTPVAREQLVDTNGAGDCYAGGFLAALSMSLPLAECCRAGAYAASVVVQQVGCSFPAKPDYSWPRPEVPSS